MTTVTERYNEEKQNYYEKIDRLLADVFADGYKCGYNNGYTDGKEQILSEQPMARGDILESINGTEQKAIFFGMGEDKPNMIWILSDQYAAPQITTKDYWRRTGRTSTGLAYAMKEIK